MASESYPDFSRRLVKASPVMRSPPICPHGVASFERRQGIVGGALINMMSLSHDPRMRYAAYREGMIQMSQQAQARAAGDENWHVRLCALCISRWVGRN